MFNKFRSFIRYLMFNIFRKKNQFEKLVAKDGIEHATDRVAEIIAGKLPNREIAYHFILEEIEGASMGNSASERFAANSGILPEEYSGALRRSIPEVDGPGGPQQLLLGFSMQLARNPHLMAEFRCRTDDKIMRKFGLGKHAKPEDRVNELLKPLKIILLNDGDVVPALTQNIPAPAVARQHHISISRKNIESAKNMISVLSKITGEGTDSIIRRALRA